MREECGIVGVVMHNDVPKSNLSAFQIYYSLYALQHRGQESTGISVHNGDEIYTIKGMGLVPDVYDSESISKMHGNVGIGHVRYSTTGASNIENCQPFVVKFKDGEIGIAHNGNLVNGNEIRSKLKAEGHITLTDSDSEVIAYLLVKELLVHTPVNALHAVMQQLVGSYSIVVLINDILLAARDPLGIKPLCIGTIDSGYVIASESVAIDTINGMLERDVKPGEIIFFKDGEIRSYQAFHEKHSAHCVFEYIYFARPDSIIDGKLVYNIRKQIGLELAQESPSEVDIIIPVPDSGITSAIGYSKELNIEYCEGLMKNRYIGRTFIIPKQEMREIAVRLKMNTIHENIKGKRVVLVDDSVVRGTTSRRIVDMVRKAGAKEVHARIGSPPIVAPCYLGIDMSTREELIAANNTIEGVQSIINADSISFISIKGLVKSIGIDENDLCIGCLTGKYRVDIPGEEYIHKQMKLDDF